MARKFLGMVIYKTTNIINNKWYIGQDKHNNPNYLGSGKALMLSVKKYGKENFIKEILQLCDSVDGLNKAEEIWIDNTNAVSDPMSYNMRRGGQRCPERFGKDNHNFGKYPEHMVSKTKKSVVCLNDGKIFDKLSDAAVFYNINVSKISSICSLKRKQHKGLIFRYKGQEDMIRPEVKLGSKSGHKAINRKNVMCIDNNMIFDSLTEAVLFCETNELKTNRQSIRQVCNKKYKTAAGMKWRWYVH